MHLPIHALRFAATQHAGQARKDRLRTPYINHPIHVMSILTDAGIDDAALLAAAALHDTVEDTNTTLAQIDELFGAEVAALVAGVTDDKNLKKAQRKQQQINHMPHLSAQAQWLKIADKIANLEDLIVAPPHDWPSARLLEYVEWATAVVAQCTQPHPMLLQRFAEVVARVRAHHMHDRS